MQPLSVQYVTAHQYSNLMTQNGSYFEQRMFVAEHYSASNHLYSEDHAMYYEFGLRLKRTPVILGYFTRFTTLKI